MKILIVEDEILVAADIEATLEDLGHVSAGIAHDTQAALRLSQTPPDLAFVDLNLRDGATGAHIGRLLGERGIGVIFVTANPRMLGEGVPGTWGVAGKPCDDKDIEALIGYAMCRRRGEIGIPPTSLAAFV